MNGHYWVRSGASRSEGDSPGMPPCRSYYTSGSISLKENQGEEAFRAWLCNAAWNKLRTKERNLRAQKRDARRVEPPAVEADRDDQLLECYSRVLSPSRQLMEAEKVRQLELAFDALPEHFREALTLSRIARLSRTQVAEHMGRTEASIRNLVPRALVALAEERHRLRADDAR